LFRVSALLTDKDFDHGFIFGFFAASKTSLTNRGEFLAINGPPLHPSEPSLPEERSRQE
jgi:hypothetical protein